MKAIAIVGNSNSGKTTLIKKLTKKLPGKIGVIKHLHQFDTPNKDTQKLSENAEKVIAATNNKLYTITHTQNPLKNSLNQLKDMDIVLIEGYKQSNLPKIVIGQKTAKKCKKPILLTLNKKENNIQKTINAIKNAPEHPTKPNLTDLINQIKNHPDFNKAGAIGSFTGVVRGINNNTKVKKLYFEKYEGAFQKTIKEIEQQLKNREGIIDARIHHQDGEINVGQDIVYVVAAATHRQQLFKAVEDGINLIKQKAPIWKKEITIEGETWVHNKKQKK
ncbi:molybdopterin synthase [Methanonatronarchaeum sp. AMET-Sl]|uniref:molybdopterin synthase n=1 Tax=Methanonatronarchaeum sp. AMET-Sl TaxID=3037654 RepID=UPI00244DE6E8|nr:molybdopterin synthase [Methanonatronarchaeum sp. AMET-Sl]WGI18058.1 molybdopterin synthase [Methanonatronarchaeum sp. AMET-Sl]